MGSISQHPNKSFAVAPHFMPDNANCSYKRSQLACVSAARTTPGTMLKQPQGSHHSVQTHSNTQVSIKGSPMQRASAAVLGWRL